jgi:hypothetical protein
MGVALVPLDTLLAESDVISIHLPRNRSQTACSPPPPVIAIAMNWCSGRPRTSWSHQVLTPPVTWGSSPP